MSKLKLNYLNRKLVILLLVVLLLIVLPSLCGCETRTLSDEYVFGKVGSVELEQYSEDESVFYPIINFAGELRHDGIYIPYDDYLEWEDEIRESFDTPKLYRFGRTSNGMGPIYSIISIE